jgi:cobalt-zinc-cadmium efflux system outer membrane protein
MPVKVHGLVFAAVVSCLVPGHARAQTPSRSLTLDGAVEEAMQHNLGLQAERSNLAAADAAVVTAKLRPNPVLSGDADSLDWLGTGFNDVNGAGPPQYAARIDVPVERGQKRALRTAVADQARLAADAQFADAARRLRLDVMLAGIDVLEAKAQAQLARDNLDALSRLLELNERRFASGAISGQELARSRVAALQYRATVQSADLALAQARLKLQPLLGRRASDPLVDIDDRLVPPSNAPVPALQLLEDAARHNRPDVAAAQRERARTQADLRLQIANGKVDYTLGAEYRRQQGVNGRGNMLGLFVSVPLPIFDRNQGEIARAGADVERADRSASALDADLEADVASAYAAFTSSRQLLSDLARDVLQPATQARDATTYMYQTGATSLLDVLDAQRAYNDTMQTYYSAQADYQRARTRLANVVGQEIQP